MLNKNCLSAHLFQVRTSLIECILIFRNKYTKKFVDTIGSVCFIYCCYLLIFIFFVHAIDVYETAFVTTQTTENFTLLPVFYMKWAEKSFV